MFRWTFGYSWNFEQKEQRFYIVFFLMSFLVPFWWIRLAIIQCPLCGLCLACQFQMICKLWSLSLDSLVFFFSKRWCLILSLCVRRPLVIYLFRKFFSKSISYSFGRIAFKIYTGIKYDITHVGCAFFDDQTIFEFLANFWNFEIMV